MALDSGALVGTGAVGKVSADRGRRDESGQATVEYILLLAFILSLGAGMMSAIRGGIDAGILVFGGTLEKDLQTGRMPTGAWTEE